MKILITGGCGFIGSHLAEYHLAKGNQVHVVDNLSSGTLENISPFKKNPHFKFSEADILNWDALAEAVQWADIIYHMAAIVGVKRVLAAPIQVIKTNMGGCEHLFNTIALSKCRPRVMIASSSMAYGDSEKKVLSETDPLMIMSTSQGHWSYAVSKIANESTAFAYYREKDIPITIMRIFNMVGPRQSGRYGMVMPTFIQQACTNSPITVFGDGEQSRSFCDVRDMVRIADAVACNPKAIGEVVNIGNDRNISINYLAELIKKRANSSSEIHHIPYKEAYGEIFNDIMSRNPNLKKLAQFSPPKHEWPLERTMDDLIARFREKNT